MGARYFMNSVISAFIIAAFVRSASLTSEISAERHSIIKRFVTSPDNSPLPEPVM